MLLLPHRCNFRTSTDEPCAFSLFDFAYSPLLSSCTSGGQGFKAIQQALWIRASTP